MMLVVFKQLLKTAAFRMLVVLSASLLVACSGDPRPLQEAVESSDLQLTSISIEPDRIFGTTAFIGIGETVQFSLNGINGAGENVDLDRRNRRWSNSNPSAGSLDRDGLFTSSANGLVEVEVQLGGLVSNTFALQVSDAELVGIDSINGSSSVSQCAEVTYSATGLYSEGPPREFTAVDWQILPTAADGENEIARIVSPQQNQINVEIGANTPGMFTLRASGNGFQRDLPVTVNADLASLTIQPATITIERGQTVSLGARAMRTDNTENAAARVVTWSIISVNNDEIATLSNARGTAGQLRGVMPGVGTVSANCGDVIATAELAVVEPAIINSIELEPSDNPYEIGLTGGSESIRAFAVTNNSRNEVTNIATWEVSSGSEFLEVDNSGSVRGEITPLAVGVARLTVSYRNADINISVNVVP